MRTGIAGAEETVVLRKVAYQGLAGPDVKFFSRYIIRVKESTMCEGLSPTRRLLNSTEHYLRLFPPFINSVLAG